MVCAVCCVLCVSLAWSVVCVMWCVVCGALCEVCGVHDVAYGVLNIMEMNENDNINGNLQNQWKSF